jgi:hypothetical protein
VYTEQLLLGELHPPYMVLLIEGGATVRDVIGEGNIYRFVDRDK